MTPSEVIALLAAVGVGGVLTAVTTAYLQPKFQHKKEIEKQEHEIKFTRYKAISIQMLTVLTPDNLHKTQTFRPDLKNIEDVKEEINTEIINSFMFASDGVINTLSVFIKEPNYVRYIEALNQMRIDLWGKNKVKLSKNILRFLIASEINAKTKFLRNKHK